MIDINIKVNSTHTSDLVSKKNLTLGEAALAIYKLEFIKNELLALEFKEELVIEKEEEENDDTEA